MPLGYGPMLRDLDVQSTSLRQPLRFDMEGGTAVCE